jgi:hypothetical protein
MVAWKRSFYSALLFFEYFFALLSREINCKQKKNPFAGEAKKGGWLSLVEGVRIVYKEK